MRPIVAVYLAVSLDGYIARDDGALDWLEGVQDASVGDYGYAAFMETVDAVVLGRNTYDAVLGFDAWPYGGTRVIVLSNRRLVPAFGEVPYAGALAPLLERLAADGVRRVYLDGGVAVRRALDEGVVDELTLSLVPVLLGSGRPLFSRGLPGSAWRLSRAESFSTGLVQLRYVRR